jgi:DUF1009 family protein
MPHSKLGILAGGGMLPALVRDACRKDDRPYHVIVFEGQGDPAEFADDSHAVVRLGAGGATIKNLKNADCTSMVLAGSIRRPSMKELRPDWWGVKFFATSGAAALGDDGLLSALIKALESEGFDVVGADELLPDFLMPKGPVGSAMPDETQNADIALAMKAAKDLGARDAGQAVVVRHGEVISKEQADGTDAMLGRLASLNNSGGILAKAMKPGQERRADLPAIGPDTVINAHAAGLDGVVIEAGNAFLLDRDGTARMADEKDMFLVGVDTEGNWQ